jgi:hypothetical protein
LQTAGIASNLGHSENWPRQLAEGRASGPEELAPMPRSDRGEKAGTPDELRFADQARNHHLPLHRHRRFQFTQQLTQEQSCMTPEDWQPAGVRLIRCKNPWDRPYFACYDAGIVAVNTCGAEAV